jgi:hypothetical protein
MFEGRAHCLVSDSSWEPPREDWRRVSFRNFSRENFVENETRFSRKYQCKSRESHESRKKGKMRYILKLVSLAICQSRNLRELQTSKIIIQSEKLVLDPKFLQDFRVKISNDSRVNPTPRARFFANYLRWRNISLDIKKMASLSC